MRSSTWLDDCKVLWLVNFCDRICSLFVGWFKICPACRVRIHNKRVSQCLFSYCWSCTKYGQVIHLVELQILEKLAEPKATQSSVAKHFGVSRKTIQNVIANKELLRGVEIAKHSHKRCHLKVEQKYEDVSEATYQWLLQMREKHGEVPIVESVVCAKAMRFANLLNKLDFKASKGWFTCWKNRYGLNLYKVRNLSNSNIQICGERRDVPQDNVEAFLVDLQKPKDEYRDENIFNADETALFYRLLPERTIKRNHVAAVGKKFSKDRVTLLLCCSATGEKLPPLVIGKYESPRCLRGINHEKLPCSYKSSRNAWMTTSLWSSWLSELNSRDGFAKTPYTFFVDNATSHRMNAELSNIKIVFIPPNCTSGLQPMDQGVIWSFKCIFRRMLLSFIVDGIDEMNQKHLMSNFDLLKVTQFIKCAWMEVHPDTIINAFRKA